MTHFKLICAYGTRYRVEVHFYKYRYLIVPTLFVKNSIPPSLNYSWTFVKNQLTHYIYECLIIYIYIHCVLLTDLSILALKSHCPDYCSFKGSLEIR